jgi:pimeloyl-ACP methyl ester carboxylesterase
MRKMLMVVVLSITALGACELNIAPKDTDPAITIALSDHIVMFDEDEPLGDRLFVFLPGSGATPAAYERLLREVSGAGMPAIGLSYPNSPSVANLCDGSTDPDCHEKVRRERVYGVNESPLVNVSPANSIENRLTKLLQRLRWTQFLDGGEPAWDKIVISGHSQGGGHAAMIARDHVVARVVFLAAPGDWVSGSGPAPWLLEPHATPIEDYYGFVHVDDGPTFLVNWSVLGMPGSNTSVDGASPPYEGAHRLTTDRNVANPHGSVAGDAATPLVNGQAVYAPVWRYLCCS